MDKADSKKVSATSPLKEVNAVDRTLYHRKKRIGDTILRGLIYLCAGFSSILILVIIGYVFSKAIPHFHFKNLIEPMSQLMNPEGLLGNIINTLYIVVGTLLFACPIGIGAAIYLNEYAKNKKFVAAVSFTTEVLSGIPSIIFGLFGMIFFGEMLGLGYSVLNGCFTLTILILPIIIRNTQVALESVPSSYREAALGIGSTKWYMIRTVILPSAMPGILTGVILGMGRIVAESAALLFTAGSGYFMPRGFFTHLMESGGTLTIQLYMAMSNAEYGQAFVIAMILIILVLIMNFIAKWLSSKFNVEKAK